MPVLKKSMPPKQSRRKDLAINKEYEVKAKLMLRDAMVKQEISYDALAKRLDKIGVTISARGLENKISRGSFPASFMLQCLDVVDASIAIETS